MIYVYQYRIYPTASQTASLNEWLRTCRYWYNRQLGERFDWWNENRCYVQPVGLWQSDYDFNVRLTDNLQKTKQAIEGEANPSKLVRLHKRLNKLLATEYKTPVAAESCGLSCKFSIGGLRERPSRYGLQGQLPGLKRDYQLVRSTGELIDFSNVPANTLQDVCKRADDTFKRFLAGDKNGKRSGKPRFKSGARYRTLSFTGSQKGKFLSEGHYGAFQITKGLGEIKVRVHRPLPNGAKLKSSSITKKADGWYLNVTMDDPDVPAPVEEVPIWDNSLGMDAVLKDGDYLALSDGTKLPSLKPFRKAADGLAKVSKAKSSARKGSRVRRKLARKEARIHQKVARQRKQHRYETAHAVVRTGAKNIYVEKLNLAGLKKRNKAKKDESGKFLPNGQAAKSGLNKSWSDAAFGMFLETLSKVAEKAGASVHKVNPAYTSQVLCYRNVVAFPDCSVREYHDTQLGLVVDRDINAALNIKQRGLQVFPVPKKVSKREGIKIVRDLDSSTVTTMVDVLRRTGQAHTIASA